MEKIICPECGALTFRGFLTYPICHQCHENLTKCGHCRHFPGDKTPCPRFDPASRVSANSVRPCEQFEPLPAESASPAVGHPLRAAVWATLFTGTMLGLLAVVASLLTHPIHEAPLVVIDGDVPSTTHEGQTFTVRLTIRNNADRRAEHLRIRLTNDVLHRFRCERVSPSVRVVELPKSRYYSLPELRPKQRVEVVLVLTPLVRGRHGLHLELLTHGNEIITPGLPPRIIEVLPADTAGEANAETAPEHESAEAAS